MKISENSRKLRLLAGQSLPSKPLELFNKDQIILLRRNRKKKNSVKLSTVEKIEVSFLSNLGVWNISFLR